MQSTVRAKAKEADKVWDERYIQRRMKDNPPSSTLQTEPLLSLCALSYMYRKKRHYLQGAFKILLEKLF